MPPISPATTAGLGGLKWGLSPFWGCGGQLDMRAGMNESRSGEQRWTVMGVTVGLCLSRGEGGSWRGRTVSAQVGGAEGQQTGLPGQPRVTGRR